MSWQPTALGRVQPVAELALAQTRRVIGRARLRAGAIQPLMEAYLESAGKLCVEEVRTADAAGAIERKRRLLAELMCAHALCDILDRASWVSA